MYLMFQLAILCTCIVYLHAQFPRANHDIHSINNDVRPYRSYSKSSLLLFLSRFFFIARDEKLNNV